MVSGPVLVLALEGSAHGIMKFKSSLQQPEEDAILAFNYQVA